MSNKRTMGEKLFDLVPVVILVGLLVVLIKVVLILSGVD